MLESEIQQGRGREYIRDTEVGEVGGLETLQQNIPRLCRFRILLYTDPLLLTWNRMQDFILGFSLFYLSVRVLEL